MPSSLQRDEAGGLAGLCAQGAGAQPGSRIKGWSWLPTPGRGSRERMVSCLNSCVCAGHAPPRCMHRCLDVPLRASVGPQLVQQQRNAVAFSPPAPALTHLFKCWRPRFPTAPVLCSTALQVLVAQPDMLGRSLELLRRHLGMWRDILHLTPAQLHRWAAAWVGGGGSQPIGPRYHTARLLSAAVLVLRSAAACQTPPSQPAGL